MLIVFGSINLDISFHAARLPAPGETVLGNGYRMSPGGKGANQAHAARLFGQPTLMVGAVGSDAFAAPATELLARTGVDLTALRRLPGQTGCAGIAVDGAGENQIVVAPGVNLALAHADLSAEMLSGASAVLMQMETRLDENMALVERAWREGVTTILNNAPAQPLPPDLLRQLDVLIVNQTELEVTARAAGVPGAPAAERVSMLAQRYQLDVVLTLGAQGLLACAQGEMLRLPAAPVDVVDTTGAGDTFAGVLSAALIEHRPWREALALASVAAGLACTRAGAQAAQPTRVEIDAALPGYLARL